MRRLYVILGDQLDRESLIFEDICNKDNIDSQQDCFWMAEVKEEATHVWSHKQRIALFLSAMRHFAEELKQRNLPLHYLKLNDHDFSTLAEALSATIKEHNPESVWLVRPGDYRVFKSIAEVCKQQDVELKQLHDQHFLSPPSEFKEWANGKKQLRLEYWYRELRKKYQVLMEDDKQPLGGKWNYDQSNRKSFNKDGPQNIPKAIEWEADEITEEVIALVNDNYPDHPGG